jgi:hypothetical protein
VNEVKQSKITVDLSDNIQTQEKPKDLPEKLYYIELFFDEEDCMEFRKISQKDAEGFVELLQETEKRFIEAKYRGEKIMIAVDKLRRVKFRSITID